MCDEDLRGPTGNYWEVAGDMAYTLPMVEMAGYQHTRFLQHINYVYNVANPLNDGTVNAERVRHYDGLIRAKQPYKLLIRPPRECSVFFGESNS